MAGTVAVVDFMSGGPLRSEMWRELSDATRATFLWPAPGTPRTDETAVFPREVPASVDVPQCFEVLVLSPDQVEILDLKPHPHERRRWVATDGWNAHRLNP